MGYHTSSVIEGSLKVLNKVGGDKKWSKTVCSLKVKSADCAFG